MSLQFLHNYFTSDLMSLSILIDLSACYNKVAFGLVCTDKSIKMIVIFILSVYKVDIALLENNSVF